MKPLLALLLGLTAWMLWRYVRQASTPELRTWDRFVTAEFLEDYYNGYRDAYADWLDQRVREAGVRVA